MASICTVSGDLWTLFHNQAILGENKSFIAGINYENRFSISELSTRTVAVAVPAGNSTLGLVYSNTGYSGLSRETGGLACGLSLSENVNAGVQIDILSEKCRGENYSRQALTFEAGMLVKAAENVTIGIHLINPVPNSIRKAVFPSIITTGLGINLDNSVFAALEAELSTGNSLRLRSGFRYQIEKNFCIRGGFSSEHNSFSFGLGYLLRSVQVDMAFSSHEKLGIITSVSLIYRKQ